MKGKGASASGTLASVIDGSFPQPFLYTNPLRQVAAQGHQLEDPSTPLTVRQGPISACGAPQPQAQRTERAFPCGCLAECQADFSARSRSVEMTRGHRSVEMTREIPGRAGNDGKKDRSKGQEAWLGRKDRSFVISSEAAGGVEKSSKRQVRNNYYIC